MTEKPRGKRPVAQDEPGHLGVNDRGNVGWEWKDDHDLLADDSLGKAARMRVLVDPTLEVKDEDPDPMRPAQNNPKGLKSGYNPYNSGALGKQSWKKKRNLRQLSEWIELRKRIADKEGADDK